MPASLDVAVEVGPASGPATPEEMQEAYAAVLVGLGAGRCCGCHPAELTRAEALALSLVVNDLLAGP